MKKFSAFLEATQKIFKERLFLDYLRRFAYGIDASCYRYIPKAVIWSESEEEIRELIKLAYYFEIPLTFRAAGTSLSGQASSENVLVICHKEEVEVGKGAKSIVCDCGVIGSYANDVLAPYGKKIGPDPATIASAKIGGIFSNNSSGMCCGVKHNSYHTIKSVRIILQDGSILDTSSEESFQAFCQSHSLLVKELLHLRQKILADRELHSLIKKKFSIKNTTGYSLNALVDFDNPKDIFNHIFIGAEGTLGFVSKVEYYTLDNHPHKACALLFFNNIYEASDAILLFAKHQDIINAAEIMDYACLKSVQHLEGMPKEIAQIQEGNCAILIQLEAKTQNLLQKNMDFLEPKIQALKTLFGVYFSLDKQEQDSWWLIRKGILPIAAGNRPKGSVVIVEDICFFIEDFTKGIAEILKLFEKYAFKGIIFGHALSGNVHFIITPNLNDKVQNKAFGGLMEDLAKVVANLQGSIKAEHGTGRMVAPFVELEWGKKAYAINKKIKNLFDGKNIFNPDVIISEDKNIHLKNFKPSWEEYDEVGELVGACMECGFCEKHCPSRNLTLTPRQRISVYVEIKRLESKDSLSIKEKEELEVLKLGYRYFGIETCATCSACANLCPLHIDTACVAKNIQGNFPKIAHRISKNLALTSSALKTAIKVANFTPLLSQKISKKLNDWIHTPIMPHYFPNANPKKFYKDSVLPHKKEVIYFSSCLNRIFSPPKEADDKRNIQEVFQSLCQKAGIKYRYPKDITGLCCSKAFKSYSNIAREVALKTFKALKEISNGGEIPIVCDHSACSLELLERIREFEVLGDVKLQIFDMPSFVLKFIMPSLRISQKPIKIGLYAPCSTRSYKQEIDNEQALIDIAKVCAKEVFIHQDTKCCGFAGDKGFLNPSLNTSALEGFVKFYQKQPIELGYSSSSTCEIGLSANTKRVWQHIIYLLDSCALQKES